MNDSIPNFNFSTYRNATYWDSVNEINVPRYNMENFDPRPCMHFNSTIYNSYGFMFYLIFFGLLLIKLGKSPIGKHFTTKEYKSTFKQSFVVFGQKKRVPDKIWNIMVKLTLHEFKWSKTNLLVWFGNILEYAGLFRLFQIFFSLKFGYGLL